MLIQRGRLVVEMRARLSPTRHDVDHAARYFTESFSSLDELMAAILRQIQEEEAGRCQESLDAGGNRRDRARGMLEALTQGVTDDARRGRVKLIESLSAGPLAASERRRGMRHLAGLVESLLLAGWHNPENQNHSHVDGRGRGREPNSPQLGPRRHPELTRGRRPAITLLFRSNC
ncbi:hypothetical protein ACWDAZ_40660, partial [Streptomyces sp. NPDC001215]